MVTLALLGDYDAPATHYFLYLMLWCRTILYDAQLASIHHDRGILAVFILGLSTAPQPSKWMASICSSPKLSTRSLPQNRAPTQDITLTTGIGGDSTQFVGATIQNPDNHVITLNGGATY